MPHKNKKLILLQLLVLQLFFIFTFAHAQSSALPVYNPGVDTQIAKYLCTPDISLFTCINQLYKFAIIVAAVVGVFFVVIAGYLYMSSGGSDESVKTAKDMLTSTIASIVILMAGYILLKAINPDLIQFHPISPPGVTLPADNGLITTNNTLDNSSSGGTLTEQNARNLLANNGITVNAQAPQTTLAGIQQSTINLLISLKTSCPGNCQVIVTGGTEEGHSESGVCTHGNGYKVDIGTNTSVDTYIKSFKQIATRSDGAQQWQSPYTNAIYALETTQGTGPHWDIKTGDPVCLK